MQDWCLVKDAFEDLEMILCVSHFLDVISAASRIRLFYMWLIKRRGDVGKYERTKVDLVIKFWYADTAIS